MKKTLLIVLAAFLFAGSAMAGGNDVDMYFDNWVEGPSDSLWSTIDNWHNLYGISGADNGQTNALGIFPNSISNTAWIAQIIDQWDVTTTNICILDGNYTVMRTGASFGMRNGTEQGLAKITNPAGVTNTLTIDGTAFGDNNYFGCAAGESDFKFVAGIGPVVYGADGARFEIDVPVVITNGGGNKLTWIRNDNNAKNETVLTPNSSLTLNNQLGVVNALGGPVEINCPLLPSLADLVIQGTNCSFNAGHDSSAFGRDMVFQGADSKLVINGGTVLAPFRKFQINSANAEIELNSTNSMNGASFVTDGANNLTLDVNAGQENMGALTLGSGELTIELADEVTNLSFADCSSNTWGGTVVISNFITEVVRFGTNSAGITSAQFAQITALNSLGSEVLDLDIDADGYLTGTAGLPDTPQALYDAWAATYPTLLDTGLTADDEPDGVNNLLEYALGGNPTNDDATAILPVESLVEADGTNWLYYVYTRRLDADDRGLTYSVLAGTDLTDSLTNATQEVGSGADDEDFETVTNRISTAVENTQFMDLKVEFND